jgi:hypothetical protein
MSRPAELGGWKTRTEMTSNTVTVISCIWLMRRTDPEGCAWTRHWPTVINVAWRPRKPNVTGVHRLPNRQQCPPAEFPSVLLPWPWSTGPCQDMPWRDLVHLPILVETGTRQQTRPRCTRVPHHVWPVPPPLGDAWPSGHLPVRAI